MASLAGLDLLTRGSTALGLYLLPGCRTWFSPGPLRDRLPRFLGDLRASVPSWPVSPVIKTILAAILSAGETPRKRGMQLAPPGMKSQSHWNTGIFRLLFLWQGCERIVAASNVGFMLEGTARRCRSRLSGWRKAARATVCEVIHHGRAGTYRIRLPQHAQQEHTQTNRRTGGHRRPPRQTERAAPWRGCAQPLRAPAFPHPAHRF